MRVYDGLFLFEDAEIVIAGRVGWSYLDFFDDEDLLVDDVFGGE